MSAQFLIFPDTKYVRTLRNVSGQFKICMESMYLDSSRCLKIYWDNPKYVWRVQDVFNMSSTYLQTVQNLYGQYVSGQFKVLPDSPKSVLKCIIYFQIFIFDRGIFRPSKYKKGKIKENVGSWFRVSISTLVSHHRSVLNFGQTGVNSG